MEKVGARLAQDWRNVEKTSLPSTQRSPFGLNYCQGTLLVRHDLPHFLVHVQYSYIMRFKAPCIDVTRRPRKANNFIKYWFGSALTLCQGEFCDAYIAFQGSNYAGVLNNSPLPSVVSR